MSAPASVNLATSAHVWHTISYVKSAQVIQHYGSCKGTADALGITISAVCQWGERVPMGRAYQLEILSRGKLRVNPADYVHSIPPKYPKAKAMQATN